MLSIQDPIVALAYLLCLASTLLCVVYAWRNWNRGDEAVEPDDVKWAKKEKKEEEEL
jgi:heme A synthase